VSASPVELVDPLAGALGMSGGIGTISEIVDGTYTGNLAGPFCYADGKVEAMQELARWEGLDLGQCYAYSDSVSDLPMLQAVGHPVAVNPDSKLERLARRQGWPIVIFSRRTKEVVRRTSQAVGASALAGGSFVAGMKYAVRYRGSSAS
jgi:phosphoserine phosphatase